MLLYGTGIVKAPLLEIYADRMINLHLGALPLLSRLGHQLLAIG